MKVCKPLLTRALDARSNTIAGRRLHNWTALSYDHLLNRLSLFTMLLANSKSQQKENLTWGSKAMSVFMQNDLKFFVQFSRLCYLNCWPSLNNVINKLSCAKF